MKKVIVSIIVIVAILFSTYYYWNNRYVKLYPVNLEEEAYVIKTGEIPVDFYKHMKLVLDNYNEDYVLEDNEILIKNKKMSDLELIYNYTKKSNDSVWLLQAERLK